MSSIHSPYTRVALETTLISFARLGLFLFCRNFLLRTLYHGLQDISGDHHNDEDAPTELAARTPAIETDGLELAQLPKPSTAPDHSNGIAQRIQKMERTKAVHFTLATVSFALCFAESCILFLLLICQSAGWFDSDTRSLNWRLSLYVLLAMNTVFVPLFLCMAVTHRNPSISPGTKASKRSLFSRMLFIITPVASYLFLLSYVPLPAALASEDFISILLTRLTLVGIVVLGLLSGFGAVSNAWAYFPVSSSRQQVPTDGDVSASERSLARIREDLALRRSELQKRKDAKTPQNESFLSRMVPSFRGDSSFQAATQEIYGLEALEDQMSRNLDKQRRRRDAAVFDNTLIGRLISWGGRLFALYCVFRFISAIVNILSRFCSDTQPSADRSATSPDAITTVLATVIGFFPSLHLNSRDISALARQISFTLVGVIILSSVRTVLRGATRLLRVTNRSQGASLMLLLLAQLLVIYLLSTLIQLRTSFPPPPATESKGFNLFTTLPEFYLSGSLFDWSYVLSALLSGIVWWADERLNG